MTTKQKLERVKMNLTLEKDFYDQLLELAERDYLRVATYTTRLLKKYLMEMNNEINRYSNEHN